LKKAAQPHRLTTGLMGRSWRFVSGILQKWITMVLAVMLLSVLECNKAQQEQL